MNKMSHTRYATARGGRTHASRAWSVRIAPWHTAQTTASYHGKTTTLLLQFTPGVGRGSSAPNPPPFFAQTSQRSLT